MYAQLDFKNNKYKRVNLIGGEEVGINQYVIDTYPNDVIDLSLFPLEHPIKSLTNEDLVTIEWYYDTENNTFISRVEIDEIIEPIIATPLNNTELAQMISDLQADLIIAGVL